MRICQPIGWIALVAACTVAKAPSEPSGSAVPDARTPSFSLFAAPPSPVSYWPGEGSYFDQADGDNNGTPIGGVGFQPGKIGQAFSLDGTGEIELEHTADLELADGDASMTIAAWIKPTLPLLDGIHLAAVVSFNYACSAPAIGIHVTDALWPFSPYVEGLLFGVRDNTDVLFQAGVARVLQSGEWHHVVGVRDGPANQLRLYLDGQLRTSALDQTGAITPLRNAAGQFVSGGQVFASPSRIGGTAPPCATARHFIGLIDEIKVWNVVLTDEQIDAEFHPDAAGPVVAGAAADPSPAGPTANVVVNAIIDDAATGNSLVAAAALSIDGGPLIDLGAVDGSFDSPTEAVRVSLSPFPVGGIYKLCILGSDARGNTGLPGCFSLLVDASGPTVSGMVVTSNPVAVNSGLVLSGTIDDGASGNSAIAAATYSIDGGPPLSLSPSDGNFNTPTEAVTATVLPFVSAGVRTLCVRGTDGPGNTGTPECVLLAVFDPEGGFVTGGGWIASPVGASPGAPGATGRANFGFVSRYKKGATIPDGVTEFQFKAGDINFQSSSYEWLVVNQNGTRAQFKGDGAINGAGAYKFMLWAVDGAPDTFRIRITELGGGVVYDNGIDQIISGGSIVIHKN